MALLVLAARVLGARRDPSSGSDAAGLGGRIVLQTRVPDHRVVTAAVRADPAGFAEAERAVRRELSLPPYSALAEVSGAGAAEMLEPLAPDAAPSVEVMGPRPDGRYLLRAPDADVLADLLDTLPRPRGRVRVAVDPPRA